MHCQKYRIKGRPEFKRPWEVIFTLPVPVNMRLEQTVKVYTRDTQPRKPLLQVCRADKSRVTTRQEIAAGADR